MLVPCNVDQGKTTETGLPQVRRLMFSSIRNIPSAIQILSEDYKNYVLPQNPDWKTIENLWYLVDYIGTNIHENFITRV